MSGHNLGFEFGNGIYSVYRFNSDVFSALLDKFSPATEEQIKDKPVFKNIFEHLRKFSLVQQILVEEVYYDRHFFTDYNLCYSKSFFKYERSCARLHFLNSRINKDEFKQALTGNASAFESIADHYAGFTVVRRLRNAVFGRTCLELPQGFSVASRKYYVNLFGRTISFDSVAFQEQDRAASACATAALWTAFSVTGLAYHHPIPAPSTISLSALELKDKPSRLYPNLGLNIPEMTNACMDVGLVPMSVEFDCEREEKKEPPVFKARDAFTMKAYIQAFVDGGIPLILSFEIIDGLNKNKKEGNHAVTIIGYDDLSGDYTYIQPPSVDAEKMEYKLDETIEDIEGELEIESEADNDGEIGVESEEDNDGQRFKLEASKIKTILVNDDQVTPYAKMEFDEKFVTTDWGLDIPNTRFKAYPYNLMILTPDNIRMRIGEILKFSMEFDGVIKGLLDIGLLDVDWDKDQLSWKIELLENKEFKKRLVEQDDIDEFYKMEVLNDACPCYVWRALGSVEGKILVQIIADATDFDQRMDSPKLIPHKYFDLNAIAEYYWIINGLRVSGKIEADIANKSKKTGPLVHNALIELYEETLNARFNLRFGLKVGRVDNKYTVEPVRIKDLIEHGDNLNEVVWNLKNSLFESVNKEFDDGFTLHNK